ncbi:hypothetical protein F3Y22_tig00110387pilonHSYRG00852 [Hibiscus syriacus]|uniref:DNA (Cytosine-5)-methyltransferase DRM1/2 n=1 Tax=Hibiscus syriacus TaxID=106335 RepID=A0A6A3AUL1_HIBSY|nr:hypothetical protein F3Y22_tig00110387pilonHSYRG00852 [Hibiscus syriacus]
MFPMGINVLSLFSGIGGAEVTLYQLDIPLKADVQELNNDRLEQLMSRFGRFDLVVGGILYNNLTGTNKHHLNGLKDFFFKNVKGFIILACLFFFYNRSRICNNLLQGPSSFETVLFENVFLISLSKNERIL